MSDTNREKEYEQIRQEHEDLRQHLGALHHILAERQLPPGEVVASFRQLREELVEHFRDEEEGGFFHNVVDHAPRYSEQVDQLCKEHEQSLQDIDQMTHDAEVGEATAEWWAALSQRFHDFSCDLMNHESKENQLLQNTYGIDIGAND